MSQNESKTTSATGGVKAGNMQKGSLIPPSFLMELAEHYGKGAEKYESHNWARGYEWSKSYDALMRHLTAFWGGEDIDAETGSKHIIAVAWHAIALSHFMDRFPEYDDRHDWLPSETPAPQPNVVTDELHWSKHSDKVWSVESHFGIRLFRYYKGKWQTKVCSEGRTETQLDDKYLEWGPSYLDYVPKSEGPFTEWT